MYKTEFRCASIHERRLARDKGKCPHLAICRERFIIHAGKPCGLLPWTQRPLLTSAAPDETFLAVPLHFEAALNPSNALLFPVTPFDLISSAANGKVFVIFLLRRTSCRRRWFVLRFLNTPNALVEHEDGRDFLIKQVSP